MDAIRSIRGRRMGPRTWPVLVLPNWLAALIAVVVLGDAVLIAVTASVVTLHAHDLEVFAGLLVCSAATVELTRRVGENTGVVKDVHAAADAALYRAKAGGRDQVQMISTPRGLSASAS